MHALSSVQPGMHKCWSMPGLVKRVLVIHVQSRKAVPCKPAQCKLGLSGAGWCSLPVQTMPLTAGLASDANLIVLGMLLGQHPTGHQIPLRGLLSSQRTQHPLLLRQGSQLDSGSAQLCAWSL